MIYGSKCIFCRESARAEACEKFVQYSRQIEGDAAEFAMDHPQK